MDYLIHQLLNEKEAKYFQESILKDKKNWKDGRETAGSHAAKVKNNFQLDKDSKTAITFSELMQSHIIESPLIKSYSLPKEIHGLMFSRSGTNQGYGMHIDNAYMGTGRSDLSFTIFLNNKEDYEGGELCIQTLQEEKIIKLSAGQIVIYPSTSLHSVKQVSKGERIVCVGWIESYIPINEDRSILFGLDAGAKGLLSKHGQSPELDLIFQSYNNLLRRLGK